MARIIQISTTFEDEPNDMKKVIDEKKSVAPKNLLPQEPVASQEPPHPPPPPPTAHRWTLEGFPTPFAPNVILHPELKADNPDPPRPLLIAKSRIIDLMKKGIVMTSLHSNSKPVNGIPWMISFIVVFGQTSECIPK